MSALALAARLKHEGTAMERIGRLISTFYAAEVWNMVKTRWLCDDPLDVLLRAMPDKEEPDAACSALLIRLKTQFSGAPVSQQALRTLLDS